MLRLSILFPNFRIFWKAPLYDSYNITESETWNDSSFEFSYENEDMSADQWQSATIINVFYKQRDFLIPGFIFSHIYLFSVMFWNNRNSEFPSVEKSFSFSSLSQFPMKTKLELFKKFLGKPLHFQPVFWRIE